MVGRILLLSVVALGCLSDVSVAHTYKPDDSFVIGPLEVTGYDPSQKVARQEANDLLDDALEAIEDSLAPGYEIIQVVTNSTWDGIAYTIEFSVFVDFTGN